MMQAQTHAYFLLCLGLGWLLRSARYSKVRIVDESGSRQVRKRRVSFAPLLIWMSDPLLRLLDTGVRILPQQAWEERERQISQSLRGSAIQIDATGNLVLPYLAGRTLATLLEDPALDESVRTAAIERAVSALAEFHRRGFTHADAMAENVLVDLQAGVAHWFDFETTHDARRSMTWRQADDVRALLATCLIRTAPDKRARTVQLILDVYANEDVTRVLTTFFASVFQRPLAFHLAQARLSHRCFREVALLLRRRLGDISCT